MSELAISNAHEVDPVARNAFARPVDEHRLPFEGSLVARSDVADDRDLEAWEVVAHAIVEGPDLSMADQGTGYGVKDGVAVEVGQHTFNIAPGFGSPV